MENKPKWVRGTPDSEGFWVIFEQGFLPDIGLVCSVSGELTYYTANGNFLGKLPKEGDDDSIECDDDSIWCYGPIPMEDDFRQWWQAFYELANRSKKICTVGAVGINAESR